MSIFSNIVEREHAGDAQLGLPSVDLAHRDRRLHVMSTMTGGRGFPTPAKESNGERAEAKRKAREMANSRVSEARDPIFMHSAARRRRAATQAVA